MSGKMMMGLAAAWLVAAAGSAEAKCHDGKDRRVKVINDTSFVLRRLYGSNVGVNSWQENVLGHHALAPGHAVTVNFDDNSCYCSFDFKAVFSDNTATVRRGFNVCKTGSWRIHE